VSVSQGSGQADLIRSEEIQRDLIKVTVTGSLALKSEVKAGGRAPQQDPRDKRGVPDHVQAPPGSLKDAVTSHPSCSPHSHRTAEHVGLARVLHGGGQLR